MYLEWHWISGYINNENQNKSVFIEDYYLTGDKGYKDDDGYIWFIGRADDVIISSGLVNLL